MAVDRHYSRILEQRLLPFVQAADADGLVALLAASSRSEQRTAGYMLGERLLPDAPTNVFWHMTEALVRYDSRALLITLMKTFLVRLARGTASIADVPFARLAATFNEVERQKVALLLLPALGAPEQVERWKGASDKPLITEVYNAYRFWHKECESGQPFSKATWKEKLKEIFGVSPNEELAPKTNRGQIIPFFCLTEETASRYPRDNRD